MERPEGEDGSPDSAPNHRVRADSELPMLPIIGALAIVVVLWFAWGHGAIRVPEPKHEKRSWDQVYARCFRTISPEDVNDGHRTNALPRL